MSISYLPTPRALRAEIKPSKVFRALLAGMALAALGAIFYAALAWPLRVLLAIGVFVYGAYCWRAQMRQRGVLEWRSTWLWRGADGNERALRLRHSTVWPGLIVLVFHGERRAEKFTLALWPDSFPANDSDAARRLRLHLHHFPVFEGTEAAE